MNILITGSRGFIGKNLKSHLIQRSHYIIHEYNRGDSLDKLKEKIKISDVIFHLAGENRTEDEFNFEKNNFELSKEISTLILNSNQQKHLIFSSTIQAELDNAYGKSKLKAENEFLSIPKKNSNQKVSIYRLPGVFGKWSKPNYNSVVATFCHNIANNIPINITDPNKKLQLIYIDDLINQFINNINVAQKNIFIDIHNIYEISLADLANKINLFHKSRNNLLIDDVSNGINKALYSTYISYLPKENFSYKLTTNKDDRGVFVEYLKNEAVGQFSYLTSKPGVVRGNHFHHTKIEKFLLVKGKASFKFESLNTGEVVEIETSGKTPEIVETIPGWAHYIKNIGDDEMLVLLWANEIFDHDNPDTYWHEVSG